MNYGTLQLKYGNGSNPAADEQPVAYQQQFKLKHGNMEKLLKIKHDN